MILIEENTLGRKGTNDSSNYTRAVSALVQLATFSLFD
jgi:hypothetical protein